VPAPTATRPRFLIWSLTLAIIGIDALVATPLGLTWVYFGPLTFAALFLSLPEVLAIGALCAASSLLFGPFGDPLGLHTFTLVVAPAVQHAITVAAALASYLGLGVLLHSVQQQRRTIRGLRRDTERDPLTGLGNRRALEGFLGQHRGEAGAVLAVDVDHFKRVNDTHGHDAGDEVLAELGRRLSRVTRGTDLVARAGGEEFVLVLPGAGAQVARRVAEDVRAAVGSAPFVTRAAGLAVTASVGAAVGRLEEALLRSADRALYASKREGRDRVTLSE
jgi:diguanylate cyclase (GGDEF)-like protein